MGLVVAAMLLLEEVEGVLVEHLNLEDQVFLQALQQRIQPKVVVKWVVVVELNRDFEQGLELLLVGECVEMETRPEGQEEEEGNLVVALGSDLHCLANLEECK